MPTDFMSRSLSLNQLCIPTYPNFRHLQVDIRCGDDDLATVFVNAGYADWIRPPEASAKSEPVAALQPPKEPSPPPLHLSSAGDHVKIGDMIEATIVYHAKPGRFSIWKVDDEVIGRFAGVNEELNRLYAASPPNPDFAPAVGMINGLWS